MVSIFLLSGHYGVGLGLSVETVRSGNGNDVQRTEPPPIPERPLHVSPGVLHRGETYEGCVPYQDGMSNGYGDMVATGVEYACRRASWAGAHMATSIVWRRIC